MLATGVGRGRLPTTEHPSPFSNRSVSYVRYSLVQIFSRCR